MLLKDTVAQSYQVYYTMTTNVLPLISHHTYSTPSFNTRCCCTGCITLSLWGWRGSGYNEWQAKWDTLIFFLLSKRVHEWTWRVGVTEIPFVDESSERELLLLLGDWYEPETFESVFSSMSSDAVFFSS